MVLVILFIKCSIHISILFKYILFDCTKIVTTVDVVFLVFSFKLRERFSAFLITTDFC